MTLPEAAAATIALGDSVMASLATLGDTRNRLEAEIILHSIGAPLWGTFINTFIRLYVHSLWSYGDYGVLIVTRYLCLYGLCLEFI